MPFGSTNAPVVFQALVNDMIRDFLNSFIFVYLEDILIFSQSPQNHTIHVQLVLQRLLESKLFIKTEKCNLHVHVLSRFIRDHSQVVVPLMKLTSLSNPFTWTPEPDLTFANPKRLLISAPILMQPDPACQFIISLTD